MKSLLKDAKFVVATIYASGTATIKAPATGINMTGYKNICFVTTLATIAASAVSSLKIQQSDTAVDDAGFVDITGAASPTIADDDDDQLRIIDVRPTKKYVRALLTKDATNALAGSILAILYNGDEVPVTQPTGSEGVYVP